MKILIPLEIEIPETPNFIRLKKMNERKQEVETVSIADLSDDQLKAIGIQWTENLIIRADKIRNAPTNR